MRLRSTLTSRRLISALAAALALLAIVDLARWRLERRRLAAYLEDAGVAARRPEVIFDLDRSPGLVRSRLRAARAVLADQLDLRLRPDLQPEQREAALERGLASLAETRRLAAEALAAQPAAWQAAMVLGGATYLAWARSGDPRLATESERWVAPLEHALRLAPGQPEAARLLAAAQLGEWTRLPVERRAALEPLLRRALADPTSFDLLIPYWLRLAPSLESAFAVVPDVPWAWERVATLYAAEGDWDRYAEARQRHFEALPAQLARRMRTAREYADGGDWHNARSLLRAVVRLAPVDRRFASTLREVIALEPPTGFGPGFSGPFDHWLSWTLDRCREGECPLEVAPLAQLAGIEPRSETVEAAQVALLEGDAAEAERLAVRLADHPRAVEIHRLAGTLARAAGDWAASRAALERLEKAGRGVVYWAEALALARASGDRSAEAEAQAALAGLSGGDAAAAPWRRTEEGWRAEVWIERPVDALRWRWRGASAEGGVVALRWDGAHAGFEAAIEGRAARATVDAGAGLHLLEILPARGPLPAPAPPEAARPR